MIYDNLYKEFKKDIPEGIEFYEIKEKENLIDETDGMHIAFGMVVVPYIVYAIQNRKTPIIRKLFLFLENMAICDDVKVNEVLDFTILEQMIDGDDETFAQSKQYMGDQTLQHCEEVEKYFFGRK